ncbi:nucleocapsid protein [Datura yellow vein nucleorhabdovirus]|uniref:Nucleoprotein n=1 Tax=Datura yellow vein nucleorhabdovirus TaxID=195059 RepID=A0A0F7LHM8_9RHAB|nr:nucleocapsid protein [Datura yellow vein nucleorhabdovirus]AKH61401.1 nucleocapsid protein [Datura yellow vein nucleorhabdovirus]
MSDISIRELQAVREEFGALRAGARPEISSGQCGHREYTFQEAAKSPIYKISTMNDEEIIKIFNKISGKDFKEMTEEDLLSFVQVALNIKHPITGALMFGSPWEKSALCADFETARPSQSNKVSMVSESVASKQAVIIPSSEEEHMDTHEDEPISNQVLAITFLFSWLTRFSVKSPSSALALQYTKLKENLMKFYQKSSKIFETFNPDSTWVICLRNAFDAFLRVRNTLVLHVAEAETRCKQDPKAFNVLRYLYFQNLEFMGMHAYVSIVTIMNKVALPPALVLTWLRMNGAELAIDEAYQIMSTLDNGMVEGGATKERLWKYARLLDAGYFNRLQTSYSAELMATLAYIEIKLGLSQEVGYASPLNIFVIANNTHIKDIGRAKAEAFMECKNSVISMSAGASVVDKIYAKRHSATTVTAPPAHKRKEPEIPAEPAKRTRTPPVNIPPPPF